MPDEPTMCICCKKNAIVIYSVDEQHEAYALCLEHAQDHQRILNHTEHDYKLEMLID